MAVEVDRAVGRELRPDPVAKALADGVRVLLPDEAEADLGAGPRRQHGLEAFAGIAALDAVDLAGRARPDHLERGAVLLARRLRQADIAKEPGIVEAEALPLRGQSSGSSGTPS